VGLGKPAAAQAASPMPLSFPTSSQDCGAGPLTRAGRPRPAGRVFNQIRMASQGAGRGRGVRPTKLSDIGLPVCPTPARDPTFMSRTQARPYDDLQVPGVPRSATGHDRRSDRSVGRPAFWLGHAHHGAQRSRAWPEPRLTYKVNGKTVTESLPSQAATRKAEREIAEFRKLQALHQEFVEVNTQI
jgi:hypothetical protein